MSESLPVPGPTGPGTDVTRSGRAESAQAAARVARQRLSQPSGMWGMILFLCSEVTLFGTLIATYYYLDFGVAHWPPPGIKPPELGYPLYALGWLVLTTIPMLVATRAARGGMRTLAAWMIAIALAMQCVYLTAQIVLFIHDFHQVNPKATAYGSIYFTLETLDHAHVLLGILLDVAILWHLVTRGLTNYWLIGVRGLSVYWYVVNAITVLVTFTLLTPAL